MSGGKGGSGGVTYTGGTGVGGVGTTGPLACTGHGRGNTGDPLFAVVKFSGNGNLIGTGSGGNIMGLLKMNGLSRHLLHTKTRIFTS